MRRLRVDHRDGLLDPPLLEPRRDPDIVVAGLHDDERGRERAQVEPRDLGGDRPLAGHPGAHVARTGVPVDDRVPVQQAGQDDGPRLTWTT